MLPRLENTPATRRELLEYLATRGLWARFEIMKEARAYVILCTRTKRLCATYITRIDDLTFPQWEALLLDLERGYSAPYRRLK